VGKEQAKVLRQRGIAVYSKRFLRYSYTLAGSKEGFYTGTVIGTCALPSGRSLALLLVPMICLDELNPYHISTFQSGPE
jgi:hypothetical protein